MRRRPEATAPAGRSALLAALLLAVLPAVSCGPSIESVREADAEAVFVRGATLRLLETAELDAVAGDFASFAAGERKILTGVGLAVSLAGTGDKGDAFRAAMDWAAAQGELRMPPDAKLEEGLIALVMIEAHVFPAMGSAAGLGGASVRPMGNAASLEDGVLLWTDLVDPGTGEVWAAAMGPILITTVDAQGTPLKTPTLGRLLRIGVKGRLEPGARRELVFRPAWPDLLEAAAAAVRAAFPAVEAKLRLPDRLTLTLPADPLAIPEDLETRVLGLAVRPGSKGLARVLVDARVPALTVVGERLLLGRGTFLLGGGTRVISFGGEGGGPEEEDLAMVEAVSGGRTRRILTTRSLRNVVRVLDRLGVPFDDLRRLVESAAASGALPAEAVPFDGRSSRWFPPEKTAQRQGRNGR